MHLVGSIIIILYIFTAAVTGAKFPNFIVFVCSGGGGAVQLVTFLETCSKQYMGAVPVSFFTHNSVSPTKS